MVQGAGVTARVARRARSRYNMQLRTTRASSGAPARPPSPSRRGPSLAAMPRRALTIRTRFEPTRLGREFLRLAYEAVVPTRRVRAGRACSRGARDPAVTAGRQARHPDHARRREGPEG